MQDVAPADQHKPLQAEPRPTHSPSWTSAHPSAPSSPVPGTPGHRSTPARTLLSLHVLPGARVYSLP